MKGKIYMDTDKKNKEIIEDYDYLANSASSWDCTGLIPTPATTEDQRESYEAIRHYLPKPIEKDKK